MLSYNNYLYQVVLKHVMTLYIIILCNCSPDCKYIIMYFWPYGLWPSGLNKLSCLVLIPSWKVQLRMGHMQWAAQYFSIDRCFREGTASININDTQGRGRKKKVTPTLVTFVANALENDRILTVWPLETKFDVSYGTMQTILLRV